MPKYRELPSLESRCLRVIVKRIDWFAVHHPHPQLDCLSSNMCVEILERLKEKGGLDRRHFELVLGNNLNRLDLSVTPGQRDRNYIQLVLDIIRVRQPKLLAINLSNILRIPSVFWSGVLPSLIHLQVLNLRSTDCGDQDVLVIANHCRGLKKLDLSLCQEVTNRSVTFLGGASGVGSSAIHQLQHLDLMQTGVDGQGIRSMLQHCPSLVSLQWRNTILILSQIYRERSHQQQQTDHQTAGNSNPFSIQQLAADNSYRLYTLPDAVALCRHTLIKITIDCPSHLLAEELWSLVQLERLEELNVILQHSSNAGRYLDFRDAFDPILLRHGKTLTQLSLGRFKSVDLEHISRTCRRLSFLNLELNRSYYYSAVSSNELTPPNLPDSCCSMNLSRFHLAVRDFESDRDRQCHRDVPLDVLSSLIQQCHLLTDVKITASHNIDDNFLSASIGPGIQNIQLESCPNVSIVGLRGLVRQPVLSSLKVYRCRLVTDDDILQLQHSIEQFQWQLELDYYRDDIF